MATIKKTASPKTISPTDPVKKTSSNDYIELRIPRFSALRIPLLFVVPLLLLSFFAGYYTNQTLSSMKVQPIVDASSAFTNYAKKLGLDTKKFNECMVNNTYNKQINEDIDSGTQAQVNATPSFFINGKPLVGAQPFEIFKAMIEHELTGSPLPTPGPNEPTPGPSQEVKNGHLPVLGNKNAKVVVVEYSDFQCPYCEQFIKNTYPQLKKDYIDTGKIAFYYRHLPLVSIHPNAKPASLASECANEQGKFWEYHDLLFANQAAWSNLPLTVTQ